MKYTFTLLCFLTIASSTISQDKPNILWIITDDHRPDAIEYYNEITTGKSESYLGYVSSPNIDKLGKEGTIFTSAYCNSPMCTPSRSSMMTGRYPFRSGHYKFYSHQEAEVSKPLVSQILKGEGYNTAVFGKTGWGIYKHRDNSKNTFTDFFDYNMHFKRDLQGNGIGDIFYSAARVEFIDGIFSPIMTEETTIFPDGTKVSYYTQLRDEEIPDEDLKQMAAVDEEFDILRSYTRLNKGLIIGGVNPQKAGETVDGSIVKEFNHYLENADKRYHTLWGEERDGADSEKPLFLSLGFHLPHTPVLPPKKFRDEFEDKPYFIPEFSTDELSNFPPQLVTLYNECKTDQLKDEEKLQAIRDYYAFCAYGDALIGEAVEKFKTYCNKYGQEYLIIFTIGDHGWHLGEQGIMAKFGPWRQSVQNAVIVVSSEEDKYPAGKVVSDIVEFVDFVPTILAEAGVNIETEAYNYLDGYDLLSVVNETKPKREYAIGEVNVVCGHRGYMRTDDFAFSMRTRDKWDVAKAPYLNDNVTWALTCERPKADMALYDLRVDPLEKNNIADHKDYVALADWFRNKLGNILLGDGRVECDWTLENSYNISNFAGGADDKILNIPSDIIPQMKK